MKKIVLFILVVLLIGMTNNNGFAVAEGKIPTCVKSTFYTQFPYAENIHWKKIKKDVYQVQFIMNDNKAGALISDKGILIESDIVYFPDDVPQFVVQELKKEQGVHIVQFSKTIDINHDEFYLLTLKKGTQGFEIIFDKNWQVLQVYEKKNIKG